MSTIEIRGVPPETVVAQVGDTVRLRTAIQADIDGRRYTGEKVVTLTLERFDKGLATFRLGEEPFVFGGQFTEAAIADLEREAAQLRHLSDRMNEAAENARRTSSILAAEVNQDLERRRQP